MFACPGCPLSPPGCGEGEKSPSLALLPLTLSRGPSLQALGSDGVRVTMESALTARDRVGVQDFVLLENFTSEAAFIENLRRRFRENLIYVRPEWEGGGGAGATDAGLQGVGRAAPGPLGETSEPPPLTPRPTLARCWSLSTPTETCRSTADSTWSVTEASASMRFHLTCE